MRRRTALMAISPLYTGHIFKGTKLFELRRRPLAPDVKWVAVYETRPTSMVVGHFEVERVVWDYSAFKLWDKVGHAVEGTDLTGFMRYFDGAQSCHAIQIKNPMRWTVPLPVSDLNGHGHPPQAWSYVSDAWIEHTRPMWTSDV